MSDRPKRNADGDDALPPLAADDESALAEALALSVRPEPLPRARHEAILSKVGLAAPRSDLEDDPVAEPTPEEAEAARAFAEALDGRHDHPDLELCRALVFASAASDAAPEAEVVERALTRALPPRKASAKVLFVSFGSAGAALALAASVILALRFEAPRNPEPRPELLLSRSVAPLLGPEASELSASARLDRIASARSRDFRSNRYAAWGVR